MMRDRMRALDAGLCVIPGGDGEIFVSPGLQGRIFCTVDDVLAHKLDFDLAAHPTAQFNNIGGNSLWPAPEGGAYAFNYPHGEWTVQDGINKVCPQVSYDNGAYVEVRKDITLLNAKGVNVDVEYRRGVSALDVSPMARPYGLQAVAYRESGVFTPEKVCSAEDVVLSAWSLEQFWGSDGIVAFGIYDKTGADKHEVVNDDFYGDPWPRLQVGHGCFTFRLGGGDRLQIGIRTACAPRLIGAYDAEKNMLVIRRTPVVDRGVYINIADNAQEQGVYSAADAYSIFNGASLGFFELETIAPMTVEDGKFAYSALTSSTCIWRGPMMALSAMTGACYNFNLQEMMENAKH